MKILSIDTVREADRYTIEHEPIPSIDLMERAALACTSWLQAKVDNESPVLIIAGPGNNGGDGLAMARQLFAEGYSVRVLMPQIANSLSEDCTINLERLKPTDVEVIPVHESKDFPDAREGEVWIDALFGSGLSRPADGLAAQVIDYINEHQGIVVSIDIPSGLFADKSNMEKQAIVRADYTLSLECVKHAYMFAENEPYVGHLELIPIGIHPEFLQKAPAVAQVLTAEALALYLRPRSRFAHKGSFGHALLVAGSYTKMGAAVMSAKAALRSGLGLLTLHIPEHATTIMQSTVPEAMLSVDDDHKYFTSLPRNLEQYAAIGVGPGLGTEQQSVNALKLLIQETQVPLVLDADALNILAENPTFLAFLPAGSILTPHPGEFDRLVGKCGNGFERIARLQELARKHQLVVVLKGAYTAIAGPDGQLLYNSTGNPGMATGGSGDILTGIILALVSQGYSPLIAAALGVFIHGKAGDFALEDQSYESLIATDIPDYLGKAFSFLKSIEEE